MLSVLHSFVILFCSLELASRELFSLFFLQLCIRTPNDMFVRAARSIPLQPNSKCHWTYARVSEIKNVIFEKEKEIAQQLWTNGIHNFGSYTLSFVLIKMLTLWNGSRRLFRKQQRNTFIFSSFHFTKC